MGGNSGGGGKGGGQQSAPNYAGFKQEAESNWRASNPQAQQNQGDNEDSFAGLSGPGGGGAGAAKFLGPILAGGAGMAAGGPLAGAYLAKKTYGSLGQGWMGDALDIRTNEERRDVLESQGISRKDTALAEKHGVLGSVLDDDEDDLSGSSNLNDLGY